MRHFFGRIILAGIVAVVGVRSAFAAGATSLEQIRFFEEKVRPLMIKAVSYQDKDLQMPPEGEGDRLSPEQVAVLTRWVEMGVPWNGPTLAAARVSKKRTITDADRRFWSLVPPRDVA